MGIDTDDSVDDMRRMDTGLSLRVAVMVGAGLDGITKVAHL